MTFPNLAKSVAEDEIEKVEANDACWENKGRIFFKVYTYLFCNGSLEYDMYIEGLLESQNHLGLGCCFQEPTGKALPKEEAPESVPLGDLNHDPPPPANQSFRCL